MIIIMRNWKSPRCNRGWIYLQEKRQKIKKPISNKSKFNYDLIFSFEKYAALKLYNFGLRNKFKGDVIYKSDNKALIAKVKSKFDGKGFLKFKFNTKLN